MPLETLKRGILYGMKENLNIQFIYPDYALSQEHLDAIETIDHTDIKPATMGEGADVVVADGMTDIDCNGKVLVLRLSKAELFGQEERLKPFIERCARLNIVLTDIETFTDEDFTRYAETLEKLSATLEAQYLAGCSPQLNLLTDRMMLDKMNNCGAGDTTITLAPDGRFYVCPAFYQSADGYCIGNLDGGLDIKNAQLYRLDHAPICRHCDAWQCHRCMWLNRKTTLEVNTPSHEQCMVAHLEREASRKLLAAIRKHGEFLPQQEIKEIDYTDPFEKRKKW